MNNIKKYANAILLSVALIMVGGCIPAVDLTQQPIPKSNVALGYVEIGSVKDLRPESKGGKSLSTFGKLRGGFGNPFSLNAKKGSELDNSLRSSLISALESSGYSTVLSAPNNNYRRIDIDVLDFWCDGYVGYKVTSSVVVKLIDTKTNSAVIEKRIDVEKGFALIAGYSPMNSAFKYVVNETTRQMASFFQSEEFKSAYQKI